MPKTTTTTAIGPVTNGAQAYIETRFPYQVLVETTGVADILFHSWNCEAIAIGAEKPKGSRDRKRDNLESYVERDAAGNVCIPGRYLWSALAHAAKYRQDPRSPRKSAYDLFRAGVAPLTLLASLGTKTWDYEHRTRVMVQRNGVTRCRPAFKAGWKAQFEMQVILPEYIPPDLLHEALSDAGRLCGLGDFRPSYGRFQITHFEPLELR